MSASLSVAPVLGSLEDEEPGVVARPASGRRPSPEVREESGVYYVADWARQRSAPPARPLGSSHGQLTFQTYGPLVRRISVRSIRSLPRTITLDDVVSAGWVGMSEALRRRPKDMPEEQFEAYASYRIRGAILDYLRALDPLTRRLRGLARDIQAAQRDLTGRMGRVPQHDELARHLGMSPSQLERTMGEIQEAGADRVDAHAGMDAPSAEPSPEVQAARGELAERILAAMQHLPERLQVVLALHYEQDSSLREIGEILGVTESRVCQLHAEAVQRIRAHLDGVQDSTPKRRRPRAVH